MGYAHHVGRVGALAVALGIGTAIVASPGVVWAEPADSGSSSGVDSQTGHADTDAPADDSTQSIDDSDDKSSPDPEDEPESEDEDEDPASEPSDGEAVNGEPEETPPARKRDSYGSKHATTAAEREPQSSADDDEGNDHEAEAESAAAGADEPEAVDSAPVHVDVDEPTTGSVSLDDPADETAEVEDLDPPASLPTAVLKTLFSPLSSQHSGDGPAAPVESPLLWTVLAFARRQFGEQKTEIGKTVEPDGTAELVEPDDNSAPMPTGWTENGPGFFTGSISGRVTATDPDGDRLTYSGSTTNDKGRVTVLSTGRFVYTPTAAARHAAAADDATDEQKVNTFTVTITDSAGNTATQVVALNISPTNAVPFGARARAGAPSLTNGKVIVTVSASDFDRDTLTFTGPTSTGKGEMVDNGDGTFTYTPTAAAREAAGAPGAPASAKIDTLSFTVSDGHGGTRTATVDVAVAPVAEASASAPGKAAGPVVVSANGTIYQVTYDVDPTTKLPTATRVSILDEDGQVLKTTGTIAGSPREQAPAVVRADGSLVLATYKESTNRSTISIVDGSGTVKTVGTVIGQPSGPMEVAPNGAVFLQTRQYSQSGDRLVRISATNGLRTYQLGTAGGTLAVAPDGSAYLVAVSSLGASLVAVGPNGNSRRVSLPSGTSAPESVVIGEDGRGYLTVARTLFGNTVTRVYTFTGTSSTVREIAGGPVRNEVVTADGIYQATYDESTGKSYISRITAGTIETSDPIDGFVINEISITPDGTVYAAIRNLTTQVDSVAVVSSDGGVSTIVIPGSIVATVPGVSNVAGDVANPNVDDNGYVAYTSGGTTYVAVLNPDGTIARTVALPAGATVRNPVIFAPDGTPYQVIQYRDSGGKVTSQAVLALSNDAVTPTLAGGPLLPNYESLQFGPDGTAYLVTVAEGAPTYHFLGFDGSGATVVSLDVAGFLVPQQSNYVYDQAALAFGADGTAYATFNDGVWALTSSGASKVLDLDLGLGATVTPVAFGPDGTPLVTVSELVGDQYVTTVKTFTPPTVL